MITGLQGSNFVVITIPQHNERSEMTARGIPAMAGLTVTPDPAAEEQQASRKMRVTVTKVTFSASS